MPRNDFCSVDGCKRWITSRRLEQGKTTCSYHEGKKRKDEENNKWIEIQDFWVGEDILFHERRYCILEIDGANKEVKAVQICYNYPRSLGNIIVTFPFGELVKFIPRGKIKRKHDKN